MNAKDRVRGYGREIPPTQLHVRIYFMQQGLEEENAINFFRFYESNNWCNREGHPISNWKMHAWEWIWNKME